MENYNHNCLVFATHKLDEGILDYLAYLKKEVEGVMDLFGFIRPICPSDKRR